MKLINNLLLLAGLSVSWQAQALVITPNDCDDFGGAIECLVGDHNDTVSILAAIDVVYPGLSSNEVYRNNVDTGEEPLSMAGAYETTFSNTSADPMDALIQYVGGEHLTCAESDCFVLAKDGNQDPNWYLFNITGLWDGVTDLDLQDFWPRQGAISFVSLFGAPGTPVPAPVVAGLIGLGLIGFVLVRRRG